MPELRQLADDVEWLCAVLHALATATTLDDLRRLPAELQPEPHDFPWGREDSHRTETR